MLLVLSPSKTLDYETKFSLKEHTQPIFLKDSERLVAKLKTFSEAQVAEMMEISPKLAELNVARFKEFHTPFTPYNARQALLAFKGDVYGSIEVESYTKKDFSFAQQHVRILSGLYGVLKPLDLIQPYRLEMGRKMLMDKTKDLYGFWGDRISEALNWEISKHNNKLLLNLASQEYFGAVDRETLKYPVVNVSFKEDKNGVPKVIALFAKQARGAMANFIIKNQLDDVKSLQKFNWGGYQYQPKMSHPEDLTFVRKAS